VQIARIHIRPSHSVSINKALLFFLQLFDLVPRLIRRDAASVERNGDSLSVWIAYG